MGRKKTIHLNALNIAMHPHSTELYLKLFEQLINLKVDIHIQGDKYGMLSSFSYINSNKPSEGLYGYFFKFTKIEKEGWYNLRKNKTASKEELSQIIIPEDLVPNLNKYFYYFSPKKHKLIFQSYESGRKFSPNLVRKMFDNYFNHPNLRKDFPIVSVSIIQESEILERIYSSKIISSLRILINRPNGDFDKQDEIDILKRMEKQNIKVFDQSMKAGHKQNIDPDDITKKHAEIALQNGFVEATTYDEEGFKKEESTIKHPVTEIIKIDPDKESFVERCIKKAKELIGIL